MPEVVDPVVALVIGLNLGDLVVVVREAKVETSSVDVNRVPLKDRGSHSTALDVPSRRTTVTQGDGHLGSPSLLFSKARIPTHCVFR